jgi:hypothetical protein
MGRQYGAIDRKDAQQLQAQVEILQTELVRALAILK